MVWLFFVAGLLISAVQAQSADAEFADMARLLRLERGSVVADVGAGGGQWTSRLMARVGPQGHVFATEVRVQLAQAILSSHPAATNLTVIIGNDDTTGLPPGCCDAILLRLVYHAFDKPESMRQSLLRALRPNGRLLIIDFPGGLGIKPDALTADMAKSGLRRIESVQGWQGQETIYALVFQPE